MGHSTLDADSSRAQVVGFEILAGTAVGFLYLGSYFPVLASLPVTCAAPALAFYTFLRNFAQVYPIFALYIRSHFTVVNCTSICIGLGYHGRRYNPAKRTPQAATVRLYRRNPRRHRTRVFSHPRDSDPGRTSQNRGPRRVCGFVEGLMVISDSVEWIGVVG